MPKQIKQLIIDIQASDDSTVSSSVQENPNKTFSELNLDLRITRFTRSFNRMFDKLEYSGVRNENGHKAIVFKKIVHIRYCKILKKLYNVFNESKAKEW